jgi:hypothetical protein
VHRNIYHAQYHPHIHQNLNTCAQSAIMCARSSADNEAGEHCCSAVLSKEYCFMNRTRALALLVFATTLSGCSCAISKLALVELPPPLPGTLRVTVASALLWPVVRWRHRHAGVPLRVPRQDALKLFVIGFCGIRLDYPLGQPGRAPLLNLS